MGRVGGSVVLTDIVNVVFWRHVLYHTREHVHTVVFAEERSAQVRVVSNEDPWIQIPSEEVSPGIVEQSFGEALEAYTLIHVT